MTDHRQGDGDSSAPVSLAKTPVTAESGAPRPGRLVFALVGALSVALLVVAGLIGFIIARSSATTDTAAGAAPAASSSSATVPALRPVVEQFMREGQAIPSNSTGEFKALMGRYGQPACVAVINGFADAFAGFAGSESDEKADPSSQLVSVTQNGATGVAVTRDPADGKTENQHWIYDGRWQFTCQGVFDNFSNASTTTTTTTAPAPEVTADMPAPTEDVTTAAEEAPVAPTAQCADGAVTNEGGGNYSTCVNGQWKYVQPTFDPNSGDGYGPNQPLPPLCVRFPQQYQC